MRKKLWNNFLSFLLALVLTVGTVATLSAVSQARTQHVLPVVEESVSAAELSASVSRPLAASPLVCIGAFLLILAIVAVGLTLYRREKRRGKRTSQGNQSYIPRADMSFLGRNRV